MGAEGIAMGTRFIISFDNAAAGRGPAADQDDHDGGSAAGGSAGYHGG